MTQKFGLARVIALAVVSGLAVFGLRVADTVLGARAAPQAAAPAGTEVAIFAGGCFWCMEHPFDVLPGVISTTSGYAGGTKTNPSYEEVSSGSTGHAEAVKVVYDPKQVSYEKLLYVYWRNVDPLTKNGQFCDFGTQYRTAIFYTGEAQRALAEASKAALEKAKKFSRPIVTEITAAGTFYPAEGYHQNYYQTNPVRYNLYRFNCGRDARLEELWGKEAGGGTH
ncbi:MAG: peptide-methionine (S)-S-oxide reductase MsrA [Alphaproteobacteria bacterium]|jgi:peptide-methionine (S)-S-oxide reductase|nr:peptide-methionine (S)-S-oxide reductase MsrA [Alphaproteobacteria bacterium]